MRRRQNANQRILKSSVSRRKENQKPRMSKMKT